MSTYLLQLELSVSRVISREEGCSELHDVLQIDSLTRILLPKKGTDRWVPPTSVKSSQDTAMLTYSATRSKTWSEGGWLLAISSSCSISFFVSFYFSRFFSLMAAKAMNTRLVSIINRAIAKTAC